MITHPLGRFLKVGFSTTGRRAYWVRRAVRLCNLLPGIFPEQPFFVVCDPHVLMETGSSWNSSPGVCYLSPIRTAVPFWGQTTQNRTCLPSKRDCVSKRAERYPRVELKGCASVFFDHPEDDDEHIRPENYQDMNTAARPMPMETRKFKSYFSNLSL